MVQGQNTFPPSKLSQSGEPLVWMHIGDLHLTETELPNHLALRDIISQANAHLAGQIDFVVLPGDNADDGTPEQYKILRTELDQLKLPVHVIPGDHDFKSHDLHAFHEVLGAERLPKAVSVGDFRCLFLDYVSAGTGGPDFKLGNPQFDWLKAELQTAAASGKEAVVFAHAYPADLADADEASAFFHGLLREFRVAVVDMRHIGVDNIEATSTFEGTRERRADGSDRDTIGAWEEKNILGTQLRPNRNGRKW